MKKLLSILAISAFLFTAPAFACEGEGCYNYGEYDAGVLDYGGALDYDLDTIPNGVAGGISGAGGIAGAEANGYVFDGHVGGDVEAIGGGLTDTDAYRFRPRIGDKSIGIGSSSESYAVAGAEAHINVDPNYGFGGADARLGGAAGQFTLNASALTGSPKYDWDSNGFTGGIAGQGSVGMFYGGAYASSGPDYWDLEFVGWDCGWCGCWPDFDWILKDSRAEAGAGAEIEMFGGSYSESYRFIDEEGDSRTEGMGTIVGAQTTVLSHGFDYDYDAGLARSDAFVTGGYIVAGGAATMTVQKVESGKSTASAKGAYFGAGTLGCDFNGSANGYSQTTVTTVDGMKGSIHRSQAGMQVTATGGNNQQQFVD